MIRLSSFQRLVAMFFAFIAVMLACRYVYTESARYLFLLWNLFLAWLPFQMSLLLSKTGRLNNWRSLCVLAIWLLFFPNALYVVTDLIHLRSVQGVPVWFDAVLLFTASVLGLMLGFASLYKVEKFLRRQIGSLRTEIIVLLCLFAGSFGVYLGRFERWNSWDVLLSLDLFKGIAKCIVSPFDNYHIWLITIIFTCFFNLLYITVKKLPSLMKEPANLNKT
jgi:uncharacterized membrane protein